MIDYDCPRLVMLFRDWLWLIIYDCLGLFMIVRDCLRLPVIACDCPWLATIVCDCLRLPLIPYVCPWLLTIVVISYDCPWLITIVSINVKSAVTFLVHNLLLSVSLKIIHFRFTDNNFTNCCLLDLQCCWMRTAIQKVGFACLLNLLYFSFNFLFTLSHNTIII